jgi:hypothetical protein
MKVHKGAIQSQSGADVRGADRVSLMLTELGLNTIAVYLYI